MQHTLAGDAGITGVGLFTGEQVVMRLKPAGAGEGIVFVRVDRPDKTRIPARVEHVIERPRRTTLKRDDAVVETVEHCLSALAAMGVDNAIIEIDGSEVPAMDGSAAPFVEAVQAAGLVELDAPRKFIEITEPITVRDGEAMIVALPTGVDSADYMFELDYGEGSYIGKQIHSCVLDPGRFTTDVAPARTFALYEEAKMMRERGMFTHLTTRDMLVIGKDGPIDNELRFSNEPVRHKLLDLIGDLSLVGAPIRGRVIASRSGHALNHQLARAILASEAEGLRSPTEGGPAQTGLAPASAPAEIVEPAMDIRQILRLLPHRYPMVLVDRVISIEGDRQAVGVKNVTINEPFFQGHYPASPIMPGVLVIEAMCQLAGLMLSQKLERTGKIAVLLSLEKVRLRRAVVPGDQLRIETTAIRASRRMGEVDCKTLVDGRLVAEARVKFMMMDAERDT